MCIVIIKPKIKTCAVSLLRLIKNLLSLNNELTAGAERLRDVLVDW